MRICLRCRASIIRKRRKISDENERTVSCHLPLFNYGEPGQSPRAVLASRKRFCSCNAAVSLLAFSRREFLNLLLAKSYRACLYTVVVFLLTQYGLGLFEKICRQYLDGQKNSVLHARNRKSPQRRWSWSLRNSKKQRRWMPSGAPTSPPWDREMWVTSSLSFIR